MPLKSYGVLVGRAVERRREGGTDSPHYQMRLDDAAGTSYRIAVNVQSQESPSELLYLVDDDLSTRSRRRCALGAGWHALPPRAAGSTSSAGTSSTAPRCGLPPDVAGPDNDLADLLDHYVQRAIADPDALVYAFGERWGPETGTKDKVFGFQPGNGVHDIHMNQGNSARFRGDDGVWQDGGLLLHLPATAGSAIFLAFQSQAWHTDDTTGHAPGRTPTPTRPCRRAADAGAAILAAMVNPVGGAPEGESVFLINASPKPVDLTGWRLADRMKQDVRAPRRAARRRREC